MMSELSKAGQRALAAYGKLRRLEVQVDRARREYTAAVLLMPDADGAEFYARTSDLRFPPVLEPTTVISPAAATRPRLPAGSRSRRSAASDLAAP